MNLMLHLQRQCKCSAPTLNRKYTSLASVFTLTVNTEWTNINVIHYIHTFNLGCHRTVLELCLHTKRNAEISLICKWLSCLLAMGWAAVH